MKTSLLDFNFYVTFMIMSLNMTCITSIFKEVCPKKCHLSSKISCLQCSLVPSTNLNLVS